MSEQPWSTGVSEVSEGGVRVRGYDLGELIKTIDFTEAIFLTLRGRLPSAGERRAFDAVLCSILDHGFINSTVTAARFVTSGNPNAIAGLAAGVLSVGSNTVSPHDSADMISEIIDAAGGDLDAAARDWVSARFTSGRRVPGLGHPTHRTEDPRAAALREVALANGYWSTSGACMAAVQAALASMKGISLAVNVDGAAGVVLRELEFRSPEIQCIGALSYVPGIIAHVVEELERGKGLRYVPLDVTTYSGPGPRSFDRPERLTPPGEPAGNGDGPGQG